LHHAGSVPNEPDVACFDSSVVEAVETADHFCHVVLRKIDELLEPVDAVCLLVGRQEQRGNKVHELFEYGLDKAEDGLVRRVVGGRVDARQRTSRDGRMARERRPAKSGCVVVADHADEGHIGGIGEREDRELVFGSQIKK